MNGIDIFEKSKKSFIQYVNSLEIHPNFKEIISDFGFVEENPPFYVYYPCLFSLPSSINDNLLNDLSIAGYFFYQSTLFLDALMDEHDSSRLAASMICQEEAIKILSSIFDLESEYWRLWNQRRNEFFEADYLEKNLLESGKDILIRNYEKLADYKSAFGKAAIDSLYVLNKDCYKNCHQDLLNSHKYFSIAFQINDDILDFQEDHKNGQFNIAVHSALKHCGGFYYDDIDKLKKLFYINGTAQSLFKKGIYYLEKAFVEVEKIDVPLWKQQIEIFKNKMKSSINEIENYTEKLNSEVSHSYEFRTKNSIEKSIEDAVKFISNKQKQNGTWCEYITQGGISDSWSTAFVSAILSENKHLKKLFSNNLAQSISFLKKNRIGLLWGYNQTWIEDSDTTNLVLLSFLFNSVEIENRILHNWLRYRRNRSGFSTYLDEEFLLKSLHDKKIDDVTGWTATHQCVSAVSFYFMVLYNANTKTALELEKYFEPLISSKAINSYWWTSNIYTYYFLAKSFAALKKLDKLKIIQKQIKKKIDKKTGCVKDSYGENIFFTGMVLEILLLKKDEYLEDIEKIKEYILKNQYKDGSWENSHSLQIPEPSSVGVSKKEYYELSCYGTSVRAREFNRLFTTVCALKSLFEYDKASSNT
ncbi:prenyltransferase/squalene oxidase repeat-containing protein [Allomuricauda sp. SCSIO 65647]|uniref:prenyltransferase/squalene oxidase repeat-containing protein n=1 Tax=Allomuricauda sp. SCSIO 65647 TaxID=2908843 RepID=UPI001F3F13E5|nr:prenyltransferase/squalene oxidase repeat-containing protein [Muricauda sp. SCSIO 65647]UJH68196.1 hypothetical protein L0P89_03065 [Muricauda sp. SCSIO 65647]